MQAFYVYRIFDGEQTLYVGKGSGRRLGNQKLRFRASGEILAYFEDEEAAYAAEVELIAELAPPLNKHPGGNGPRVSDGEEMPHGFTPEGLALAAPALARLLRAWSCDSGLVGILSILGAYIDAHGLESVQSAVLPHLKRLLGNSLAIENKL